MNVEEIRKFFAYDPITGNVTRLVRRGSGQEVGDIVSPTGKVHINNKLEAVSRVAWVLHYGQVPVGYVDHKNHNRRDNSAINLREASPEQNMQNMRVRNLNGFKGVFKRNRIKKPFVAAMRIRGKYKYIGSFSTAEEAGAAYAAAALEAYGEFACAETLPYCK